MRRLVYLCLQQDRPGHAVHTHVHEIVAGLRRRAWDVELLVVDLPTTHEAGSLRRIGAGLRAQLGLLRPPRPSVVYIRHHVLGALGIHVCGVLRVPVVVEMNGPVEELFTTWPSAARFRRIAMWAMSVQLRRAAAVVAVTAELARQAEQYGASRTAVIPNGADVDVFRPELEALPDLPPRYVCFFGSFAPWQGIEVIVEATALSQWPPDVAVVFVGNGPLTATVRSAADRDPDRFLYLGRLPQSDLARVASNALAGLSPQHDPGGRLRTGLSPLKVYETAAAGRPVVLSRSPGVADEIEAWSTGVVVEPGDPGGLADAVARLAADRDEADAMGRRGRRWVEAAHSWDRRAASTDELLRDVVVRQR